MYTVTITFYFFFNLSAFHIILKIQKNNVGKNSVLASNAKSERKQYVKSLLSLKAHP